VWWCDTVLAYEVSGSGFVNGNRVSRIKAMYFKNFLYTATPPNVGYSQNSVKDVLAQSGSYTEYGVKNLCGTGWTFDDVALWDLGSSGISAEITAGATDVRIIGGFLTVRNFTNNAADGQVTIVDDYQTRPWLTRQFIRRDEMTEQLSLAATPTKVAPGDWPAWSLQDANCGVIFLWRVPAGVGQVEVALSLLDLSGATGNAHIKVQFRSAPGAGLSTRDLIAANPAANTVSTLVAGSPFNVTAGTVVQFAIWRNGSASDDTLAGAAIGLLGAHLRPIK
jgi:hypothetical protein